LYNVTRNILPSHIYQQNLFSNYSYYNQYIPNILIYLLIIWWFFVKVLLLNTYDSKGGAAKAVFRLFNALKDADLETKMLVQEKRSDSPDVLKMKVSGPRIISRMRPYFDFTLPFIYAKKKTTFFPGSVSDNVAKQIDLINPDIVHLNWISGGFIKIENLAKINQPKVWTLHDVGIYWWMSLCR